MDRYSFANFFDVMYWFNPHPIFYGNEIAFSIFLYGFILILLGGVGGLMYIKYAKHLSKVDKNMWKSMSMIFFKFSGIGLAWVFFRYQNVYFLSMRVWIIVILIWIGYVFYKIIQDYKYQITKVDSIKASNIEKYRYVPKKKKSK